MKCNAYGIEHNDWRYWIFYSIFIKPLKNVKKNFLILVKYKISLYIIHTAGNMQFITMSYLRTFKPIRYPTQNGVRAGPHLAYQGCASLAYGLVKAIDPYFCVRPWRATEAGQPKQHPKPETHYYTESEGLHKPDTEQINRSAIRTLFSRKTKVFFL